MQEIKALLEKIVDNKLIAAEIFNFTDRLRESMRKGTPIVKNASLTNIELLETYAFALQKVEMTGKDKSSELRAADWREQIEDFSRLKVFVDELQRSELVSNVAWNVGGMAIYEIPNPTSYRNYIYWKLQSVLNNMLLFEKL
ncbi:MAG: hypothetical protein PHD41_05360 [Methanosarcinaceae archaeon]|nr:hypothetical protein [Methanosarcinaceae archaeon]MDD4331648.1 hypothetical protein [Methanosarcinaceae archaeon]MDD4749748.1 hypothetical protein [Methanosarcinaceae archaeon]